MESTTTNGADDEAKIESNNSKTEQPPLVKIGKKRPSAADERGSPRCIKKASKESTVQTRLERYFRPRNNSEKEEEENKNEEEEKEQPVLTPRRLGELNPDRELVIEFASPGGAKPGPEEGEEEEEEDEQGWNEALGYVVIIEGTHTTLQWVRNKPSGSPLPDFLELIN